MRIYSADRRSWIALIPWKDGAGYQSFCLEAFVDIGHGQFMGKNSDIALLNRAKFAASLEAFITDRSLVPYLEGTYDSFIRLSGTATKVMLSFCVGDAFCGGMTFRFALSGAFEIEQESLLELAELFKKLRDSP